MPEFTLPLRPASTNRRLIRKDTKPNLRAVAAAAAAATEPDSAGNTPRSGESHSRLKSANPEPARELKHATSPSQLGPAGTNKVLKPALRKKTTRADLKGSLHALTTQAHQDRSAEAEQAAKEEGLALVEEHLKNKATTKEMVESMSNTRLKPRQSTPLLRKAAKDEIVQGTLKTLTPSGVRVHIYLVVSFRTLETQGAPIASITILANDLSTLAAFSAELQVEHSSTIGTILLRSKEPRQWLFQSRPPPGGEGGSTSQANEYSRACSGEDAELIYEGFLAFLKRKGQLEAARAIEATQQKQMRVQEIPEQVAQYTVEDGKRESAEVHVLGAVNIFGDVVILF
ncbi:hypothetical protein H2200_007403 [Cladophialophora chaetospira]|uniref:Uncharacterized protein n=1 Tax=Cladophialophora chaetospira TaxID=386627 RepID=A0AA38X7Q8_9EURO|nr:hypothetical protein H2200_007403 [Cladophialophora chaetospira]